MASSADSPRKTASATAKMKSNATLVEAYFTAVDDDEDVVETGTGSRRRAKRRRTSQEVAVTVEASTGTSKETIYIENKPMYILVLCSKYASINRYRLIYGYTNSSYIRELTTLT